MSMVTLLEAQTYFDSKINTASWENQPALQQKALNNAELIVNALAFSGSKTDPLQTDQFPRDQQTLVPVAIKQAIYEIAYALLDGVDPELEQASLGLLKQTIASASTTFDHTDDRDRIMAGVPSSIAWGLLLPYLLNGNVFRVNRV